VKHPFSVLLMSKLFHGKQCLQIVNKIYLMFAGKHLEYKYNYPTIMFHVKHYYEFIYKYVSNVSQNVSHFDYLATRQAKIGHCRIAGLIKIPCIAGYWCFGLV